MTGFLIFLVIVFALIFLGFLINWFIEGISPVQYCQTKKKEFKKKKQEACAHEFFNIRTENAIKETDLYRFAYKYMDFQASDSFKKINEENDIQERLLPSLEELRQSDLHYCPKCKTQISLNNQRICTMAINDRRDIDVETKLSNINKKYKQGVAKK